VTVSDENGNESADSGKIRTFPGTIKAIQRPAYFATFFADPRNAWLDGNGNVLDAKIDSMSRFDCLVGGPFNFEGNTSNNRFYVGLVDKIRVRNPDFIWLTYIHPWQMPWDSHLMPESHPYRQMMDYSKAKCIPGDSTGGFMVDMTFHIARSQSYPGCTIVNFITDPIGTSNDVAKMWVDAYVATVDQSLRSEYTGFFVDDLTRDLEWYDFWNDSSNHAAGYSDVDLVVQGETDTAYHDSDNAKGHWDTYMKNFIVAMRRELAKNGLQNILIVPNSDLCRAENPEPNTYDDDVAALCDGFMNEGWNRWTPGPTNTEAEWTQEFAINEKFTHAQVAPVMRLFQTHTMDGAEQQKMSEPLSLAGDMWICASSNNADYHANIDLPPLPMRLPDPGTFIDWSYKEGGAATDTLMTRWSNMYGKLVLGRNTLNSTDEYAVWPFMMQSKTIAAPNDTLTRSQYWPRSSDPTRIAAPQIAVYPGDNTVTLEWAISPAPGNINRFNIYRDTDGGDLFKVVLAQDTETSAGHWAWRDTTAANDSTSYCYIVVPVSTSGVVGFESSSECETPTDLAPPPAPEGLTAAGGTGLIALDWGGTQPVDFLRYRIFRSIDGASYAQIDSTTVSNYDDESAVSGQFYIYYVKAVDNDMLRSLPSNYAAASWVGQQAAAPTGLVVFANAPSSGKALLNWTAPSSVVGLTRYLVYRSTNPVAIIALIAAGNEYDEGTTATSYTDNNATADSTFVYGVTALFGASESVPSNFVTNTNPAPPISNRITDGLAALWEFDGLSGTTVPDVSGVAPALDLTLVTPGTASWTPYAINISGGARLQSAAASKITSAAIASGGVSIEMWIKPTTSPQQGPARIFALSADNNNRNIMLGHGDTNGYPTTSIVTRVRTDTPFNTSSGSLSAALTQVVYTRGADNIHRVYINGSLSQSAPATATLASWVTTYPIAIGNENVVDRPWNGEVHLVAAYSRAMTDQEILHNYTVGVPAGFGPATTAPPALASASGGTSGITLTWNAVSGADKYRIFRDTASSPTTQIDSTTTATTYFDSGAVENQTYYYRVKAVSATTGISPYSNEQSAVWRTVSPTSVTISGVSGTFNYGNTITVTGSGFGTFDVASDMYDNMEAGGFASGWTGDPTGNPAGSITVAPSGANARHALSAYNTTTNFVGAESNGEWATKSFGSNAPKWFGQYWFKIDPDFDWGTVATQQALGSHLANIKLYRVWSTDSTPESIVTSTEGWTGGIIFKVEAPSGAAQDVTYNYGHDYEAWDDGQWHCMQWETQEGSGLLTQDGQVRWWIDGQIYFEKNTLMTHSTNTVNKRIYGLGWFNSCGDPSTDDNHVYFDDMYASPSWARVEIGNMDTYEACTHRETQNAASWSDGTVTFPANTGSFANGGAYLYVTDKDGNVNSAGTAITIANAAAKNYNTPTSSSVTAAGVSARVWSTYWPAGVTASITVRCVNTWTGQVVDEDTSTSAAPADGPVLTGLVVGQTYRLEYKTTTATEGYDDRTEWATFFGPFVQRPKAQESVDDIEF
jgi:fibronectin type 3 domain-containing protein